MTANSSSNRDVATRGLRKETPLSIGELNVFIKQTLETAVPRVWVEGEVSDVSRPSSGHLYFSLKDSTSQIRAVIWRSTAQRVRFELEEGVTVVAGAKLEVYPPRGTYQLILDSIQPKGVGPLQLAFQQLHQKLAAQGLFDKESKQSLPRFPKRVGFVTSPSGAAIHDFLETAKRRWKGFELFILPARVQGEFAAAEIAAAISAAQRLMPALDLLVVGRGGGSPEDLWAFNEEPVVRAIAAARLPIVSAVGHEIDVTLSDLAADVRALTPTHAAQLVFPDARETVDQLVQLERRARQSITNAVAVLRTGLRHAHERGIMVRPHEIHLAKRQRCDELELAGRRAIDRLIESKRDRLKSLARATEALSPMRVLARGYSLTLKLPSKKKADIQNVQVGDRIETRLEGGALVSRVEDVTVDDE